MVDKLNEALEDSNIRAGLEITWYFDEIEKD